MPINHSCQAVNQARNACCVCLKLGSCLGRMCCGSNDAHFYIGLLCIKRFAKRMAVGYWLNDFGITYKIAKVLAMLS